MLATSPAADDRTAMLIKFGTELRLTCARETPLVLLLSVRQEQRRRLLVKDDLHVAPDIPLVAYIDSFGNRCTRLSAPENTQITVSAYGLMRHDGKPDPVLPDIKAQPIADLPAEALRFLLSSRYCEADLLTPFAWSRFAATAPGWPRVQAICDFVHQHIRFSYGEARPTRSANDVMQEGVGVCRDFAHLAIALCRAMGIPARYTTGYLGDIGVPVAPGPMDFSAWFEAFLDGRWVTFDARHNRPRIGRIPIAYGQDAADVAFVTSFGPHVLNSFRVWTDEVPAPNIARTFAAPALRFPSLEESPSPPTSIR